MGKITDKNKWKLMLAELVDFDFSIELSADSDYEIFELAWRPNNSKGKADFKNYPDPVFELEVEVRYNVFGTVTRTATYLMPEEGELSIEIQAIEMDLYGYGVLVKFLKHIGLCHVSIGEAIEANDQLYRAIRDQILEQNKDKF